MSYFWGTVHLFEGFYYPIPEKNDFCDIKDIDCLKKIKFPIKEIEAFLPFSAHNTGNNDKDENMDNLTPSECSNQNSNRTFLVSNIGKNLYLAGSIGKICDISCCSVNLYYKKGSQLVPAFTQMTFECLQNKSSTIQTCTIVGGLNLYKISWEDEIPLYEPLRQLYNKYYNVHQDYVRQYIQRNSENGYD